MPHDHSEKPKKADDHLALAIQCLAQSELSLRYWAGEWYQWSGTVYRNIPPDAVKKRIVTFLQQRGSMPVNRTAVNAVLDMMRLEALVETTTVPCWLCPKPKYPANQIVAVKNGLLHLPGLVKGRSALLPHAPTFFNVNCLPYDYVPDAACPKWEAFLDQVWGNDPDSIRTLQEWFGYLLLPDTSQQKLLMIVGPTRSGKGTVARVVRMMLGENNVASPMVRSLAGSFGLWALFGKPLAIIPDASVKPPNSLVELIKSVVGEDALNIDRKNLPPLCSVKLPTRLMIVANDLPQMADPSGALAERLVILQTRRSWAGKEDIKLTEKLLTELPGVLLWAMKGWQRLKKRGHFCQPKSSRRLVEQYRHVVSVDGAEKVETAAVKAKSRPVRMVGLDGDGQKGKKLRVGADTLPARRKAATLRIRCDICLPSPFDI